MCTLRTNEDRLTEAMSHCELALEIDPTFCDTHCALGFLHIRRNDLGGAVASLNQVTNTPPYLTPPPNTST